MTASPAPSKPASKWPDQAPPRAGSDRAHPTDHRCQQLRLASAESAVAGDSNSSSNPHFYRRKILKFWGCFWGVLHISNDGKFLCFKQLCQFHRLQMVKTLVKMSRFPYFERRHFTRTQQSRKRRQRHSLIFQRFFNHHFALFDHNQNSTTIATMQQMLTTSKAAVNNMCLELDSYGCFQCNHLQFIERPARPRIQRQHRQFSRFVARKSGAVSVGRQPNNSSSYRKKSNKKLVNYSSLR